MPADTAPHTQKSAPPAMRHAMRASTMVGTSATMSKAG